MRLRLLEDGELWLVLYYPLVAGYALLPRYTAPET